MRVYRQIVVRVRADAMMARAALPVRIDVNHHAAEVRHVVE